MTGLKSQVVCAARDFFTYKLHRMHIQDIR